MDPLPELLAELRYGPTDVERDAQRAPQTASGALLLGGGLGLLGVVVDARLTQRERASAAAGSVACVGIGVLAGRMPMPLMVPARSFPGPVSAACYVGAIASTAFGGGHRSPAYFPAALLTAVGSAIASSSQTISAAAGSIVAGGYLAGCARSISHSPETSQREIWSAASYACGFVGAGLVGSIAGELVLRARVLSDYAAREQEASDSGSGRAAIDEQAGEVRERGRDFLHVLAAIDEEFSSSSAVASATASIATALASLRNADTQLSEEEENERLGSWRRLARTISKYNREMGDALVTLDLAVDPDHSIDAESTSVLLDSAVVLIQNAGNARGSDPVRVTVRVTRERSFLRPGDDRIVMSVQDDAGGSPPPKALWREGLWECDRRASECAGSFEFAPAPGGVRAIVALPYLPSSTGGTRARTYTAEYEQGRDAALGALRAVTVAQAAFLIAYRGRHVVSSMLHAALIMGAGEACEHRLPARGRELARPALTVAAMAAFAGEERPPMGGWAATMCASTAANGAIPYAWLSAGLAMAASTARAGPDRFRSALPITLIDRAFALIGAGSGMIVWRGLKALEYQEAQLGGEAWRRKLLIDLTRPDVDHHHFLKPLKEAIDASSPGAWQVFTESPLGGRLSDTRKQVRDAQHKLAHLLRTNDPVLALQAQLARLLQPSPVKVHGFRPTYTLPDDGKENDSVGYRLGVVGVGQALAEAVRAHLPPTILGRHRLRELRVELRPGPHRTRVDVVQVPFSAPARDRSSAALDAASREAGGRAEVSSTDRHTIYVHNSALG
jgi:hypothetical protein